MQIISVARPYSVSSSEVLLILLERNEMLPEMGSLSSVALDRKFPKFDAKSELLQVAPRLHHFPASYLQHSSFGRLFSKSLANTSKPPSTSSTIRSFLVIHSYHTAHHGLHNRLCKFTSTKQEEHSSDTHQIGGATLTTFVVYLSLNLHERNRIHQANLLRQQTLVLNRIVYPQPPTAPPTNREERASLSERLKDRWNDELETNVRKLYNVDWASLRENLEDRVGGLWGGALSQGRDGAEVAGTKIAEGAHVVGHKVQEGAVVAAEKAREGAVTLGRKAQEAGHQAQESAHMISERTRESAKNISKKTKGGVRDTVQTVTEGAEAVRERKVLVEDPPRMLGLIGGRTWSKEV